MIVAEEPYETTDPTIDSQIVKLKSSGADVFFNITTPKFAAQAIKKVGRDRLEAGALPQQRLGLGRQRDQAGRPRELQGHHLAAYLKDPTDPQWKTTIPA
jgi:branched-chain amino acid transport system substrate-binding protein